MSFSKRGYNHNDVACYELCNNEKNKLQAYLKLATSEQTKENKNSYLNAQNGNVGIDFERKICGQVRPVSKTGQKSF